MNRLFKIVLMLLVPTVVSAQDPFLKSDLIDSTDMNMYREMLNKENHKSPFYSKYVLSTMLAKGDQVRGQGHFAKAEEYYKQAAALSDRISTEVSSQRILFGESIYESEIHLGQLYLATNNIRKAEFYFNSALDIKQKHLKQRSVFIVNAYVGLGDVHVKKGENDKALFYFTQAEKLLDRAFTSNYDYSTLRKEIHIKIYELLLAKKEYKSALKYMKQLSSGGRYNSNYAQQIPAIFELKARYYLGVEDFEKTTNYLSKAKLYLRDEAFSTIAFRIARTEALSYWTKGEIEKAAKVLQDLILSYKSFIFKNFPSMSEYERESFYSTFREDFEIFNSFTLQNQNYSGIPMLLESMYDNQLFGKALLLNEINKLKSNILKSDDKELQKALLEWEGLKTQLSTLYYKKKIDKVLVKSTEDRIIELEKKLTEETKLLDEANRNTTWRQVKAMLSEGEAAVEIVRVRKYHINGSEKFNFSDSLQYVFLIIDKNSQFPDQVVLNEGQLLETRFINYYRNSIRAFHEDTISYTKFWQPVSGKLNKYNKIFLSSDGIYNQVNLNTMLNPSSGKYLDDEIEIIHVTNTKDLLVPKSKLSKVGSLYGQPIYRSETISSKDEAIIKPNDTKRKLVNENIQTFREQDFTDLPATKLEIEGIRDLLSTNAWRVSTAMGLDASEARIKAEKSPGVLHIATHGFFLGYDKNSANSMIRSGIVLAGVNNEEAAGEDGVLTAYEVTSLNLDSTYLVVLSACETGLGEIKNGEGVYGLQRGFNVAGAHYLLMSLWKVDDFATSMLMERFYSHWLNEGDIHKAYLEAQRAVREKFPHPHYWGSFILLGI